MSEKMGLHNNKFVIRMISIKKIIPYIFGIFLLCILFLYVGFENIIDAIFQTNIFFFILAAFSYLFVQLSATLELKLISRLKFKKIFLSHQCGLLLSQITPGRVGYVYTSYSIAKKEKRSFSETLGLLALIQCVMIGIKILSLLISIVFFSFYFQLPEYLFLSILSSIFIFILIFFILYSKASNKFLSKIPALNRFARYLDSMQKAVKTVSKNTIFKMVILDLVGWFFFGLQFYFLSLSLNINLSFVVCLMLHPLISAVMFIPISPTGLGLAESENELIFSLMNLPIGTGVTFLLMFRLNSLIIDFIGLMDLKAIKIQAPH